MGGGSRLPGINSGVPDSHGVRAHSATQTKGRKVKRMAIRSSMCFYFRISERWADPRFKIICFYFYWSMIWSRSRRHSSEREEGQP
ncbi:hypothetical protein NL676_003152 [Syzygium grande]|nr:hypothetical protein NL676_003152 [Syzygium grande]